MYVYAPLAVHATVAGDPTYPLEHTMLTEKPVTALSWISVIMTEGSFDGVYCPLATLFEEPSGLVQTMAVHCV